MTSSDNMLLEIRAPYAIITFASISSPLFPRCFGSLGPLLTSQNTPEKKNAMDVVLCELFPSLLFPHSLNREISPNFASYNRQEVIGFVTTSRQDG